MLLTVPVYQANVHLLADFVAVMRQKGGLRQHPLLFVAAPSVFQNVQQTAPTLRQICPEVDIVKSEREPVGTPVWAANQMFQDVDGQLRLRKNKERTFYCDLTCTPLTADCWDKIEAEWSKSQKLFSGVTLQMPKGTTDRYMMICGGYPGDLEHSHNSTYGMMRAANRGYSQDPKMSGGRIPPPMEINLGGAIVGQAGANHTELICYQPGAKKFTCANGMFVSDDGAAAIQENHVLHVGCIDGSLAKLLTMGHEVARAARVDDGVQWRNQADMPKPFQLLNLQPLEDRMSKVESSLDQILQLLKPNTGRRIIDAPDPTSSAEEQFKAHAACHPIEEHVVNVWEEEARKEPEKYELPATVQGRATLEKVHELVKNGEVSMADAHAALKSQGESITPPMIRAFVKQPESGLVLEGGMIRRADLVTA